MELPIKFITEHTLASLVILAVALGARFAFLRGVKMTVSKSALEARAQTLASIAKNVIDVGVGVAVVLMLLSEWGLDIGPLLAGAGIAGLAVGFGTQTLVKDVVTGFFILLENQFNVGDTVKIAGIKGKVVEAKLRTTVLEGENGTVHIIPNSKIAEVSKFPT